MLVQDAYAEKIELATAIHGAFDELEAVDLTLDLTRTPVGSEGHNDSSFVTGETFGKDMKFGKRTGGSLLEPRIKLIGQTLFEDGAEGRSQLARQCKLRQSRAKLIQMGLMLWGEGNVADEEPGDQTPGEVQGYPVDWN